MGHDDPLTDVDNLHALENIKAEKRERIRKNRASDAVHHAYGSSHGHGLSKAYKKIIREKITITINK